MKLLPIGSVIQKNEILLSVIGYTTMQASGKNVCGYYVVPYPVGYVSLEKIFFIPEDSDYDLVESGFVTEDSRKVLNMLGQHLELSTQVSAEEYGKVVEKIKSTVDAIKEEAKK